VNLGEFLLGYPDTRERTSRAANVAPALFKNGSFLAMRKLEQHVERFEEYASAMGGAKEGCPYSAAGKNAATLSKEHVKSLIVGRDYDTGESLAANGRNTNAFTFEDKDDPGREVPLFSHTRRTNPRTPGDPIPRILRRSFSFGPPPPDGDGAERGLLFMAYNAHIGRQFEVLQRWINGSNITGLSSRQNDLLCGAPSPGARRFAKKDGCVYEFVAPQQPFVTLHWGMYLFAPSREALATLAGEDGQTGTMGLNAPRAPEPSATMKMLLGINANKATARATWKWLLEGDYTKKDAIAAWTAIRDEAGGVFVAEEYGLLVGTVVGAKAVLGDDGTKFSVREYLRRMQDTIGRHYLGLDLTRGKPVEGGGTYEELSARANAYIPGIIDEKPFEGGQAYAAEALQLLLPPGASFGADVDTLKTFAAMVVGRLAQTWLGLPLPPDAPLPVVAELIGAFALISQCTFQPYPDAVLVEESKEAGKKLVAAYRNEKGGVQGGLAQHLRGRSADRNAADVAVIGAIIGFAAPAIQCIVTALLRLSTHPRIEEIKGHRSGSDERRQFVRQFLAEFLSAVPVPSILYRTLVDRTSVTLFGERHEVDAGTLVVLGLQSLVADAALTVQSNDPPVRLLWMFGGEHHGAEGGAGKPVHGCPAREPVLLAIAGVLDAALDKV
jgi:hypothetical protein